MSVSLQLPDAVARHRFVHETDRNFSVLAPAGVGKTRAIVDRIVHGALADPGGEWLASLVVVTYTNKAADEMQQRARNALLAHRTGPALMAAFNRAFFGTIHGFCLSLLRTHGHALGLPAAIELIEEDAEQEAWTRFYRDLPWPFPGLTVPLDRLAACLRHMPVRELAELARHLSPDADVAPSVGPCPVVDAEPLLAFTPRRKNDNAARGQAVVRRWLRAMADGDEFVPLPDLDKGGREFLALLDASFGPLRGWLGRQALVLARDVARAYRAARIRRGALTFADQVALTRQLLAHPLAAPALRRQGCRVILDEAQDTDPDQFQVLVELARPADGAGTWMESGGPPPAPGRFSMVGDPQQSIYSARADLPFYRSIRQRLVQEGAAEELEFHVTFRCSRAVTAAVNTTCAPMLNGQDGQVDYVSLRPRPDAPEGAVIRLPLDSPAKADGDEAGEAGESDDGALKVDEAAAREAGALAAWLVERGERGLGVATWSDVAILCARKRWIAPTEAALLAAGLPVDNHSRRAIAGDTPAYAWAAALAAILADPTNAFEIVGVLREVYGLSDQELHDFHASGGAFQIERPTEADGPVAAALNRLHAARRDALRRPLLDAMKALFAATEIEARLLAIAAPCDARAVTEFLDGLLGRAAAAESDGLSPRDWARRLRAGYRGAADTGPTRPNAVQLLSCHIAKGLEWDTVIVPFLGRPVATRGREYPFVAAGAPEAPPQVVLSRSWMDADAGERIKRRAFQENQRLLYVAMTRAKRRLVLVDDIALFGGKKGSFADCLGLLRDPPPSIWAALPADDAAPAAPPPPPSPSASVPVPPPLTPETIEAAMRHADRFPRRVLPHALAEHAPEDEPESRFDAADEEGRAPGAETARRYGLWWHDLMERLDWKAPDAWPATFGACRAACPLPDRATREWDLLRASGVPALLAPPEWVIHVEIPFLRALAADRCVEGIVDLAAYDPRDNAWLLLDWKTNLVSVAEAPSLADLYAPQLAQYADAIRAACRPSALRSCLYSTATGRLIPLDV